jgi:hypothetical protein
MDVNSNSTITCSKIDFVTLCNLIQSANPSITYLVEKAAYQVFEIAMSAVKEGKLTTSFKLDEIKVFKPPITGKWGIEVNLQAYQIYGMVEKILSKHWQINSKAISNTFYTISWQTDNKYLNPKPLLQAEPQSHNIHISAQMSEFNKHRKQGKPYSDTCLQIGQDPIWVNSGILCSRSAYFTTLFSGQWKENIQQKILIHLEDCDPTAFNLLLDYLHGESFENLNIANNPEQLIALARCSHFYQEKTLLDCCRKSLWSALNKDNIFNVLQLGIDLSEKDQDPLIGLCQWFLKVNPGLENEFDLSNLDMKDLLWLLGLVNSKYVKHEGFNQKICDEVKSKLSLDNFAEVCAHLIDNNNKILKGFVKQFVRTGDNKKLLQKDEKAWSAWTKLRTESL